jgi:NTP pyrophosphatase (non-canonical NTP hydrolase)
MTLNAGTPAVSAGRHDLQVLAIARTLMLHDSVILDRNGMQYVIAANENGEVYGWFSDADEGDPATTPCFGTPEEDDMDEHTAVARAIVEWHHSPPSLNDYAAIVHRANRKWWIDVRDGVTPLIRNKGELLALIHSEISEALEGERKNLMDDKLPHRKMAEVELADALIRILDYSAGFGYDIEGAFREKMAYNATREDHTHEARKIAGGKQF